MSYLNRTHGTCVYFFFLATGIRRVSAHQPPFLAPRDAFSGSAGRSEVPSFSRDEASRAGVPPSCPSHTWSPALIVSAFSKKEKKKKPVSAPLHSLHNENHCDLCVYTHTPWEDFTAV